MKAGAMLYIVGYWHLSEYVDGFETRLDSLPGRVTQILLGLFVFVSGFLLGDSRHATLRIGEFYRRRLIRIFPLYALAVLVFYLLGINNFGTSVRALLGVAMLWQPAPLTLWFVTMLLVFYLLTPLLLRCASGSTVYCISIAGVLTGVIAIQLVFKSVDSRLLLYFPCYCLGIVWARQRIPINKGLVVGVIGMFLIGTTVSTVLKVESWTLGQLKDGPMILAGALGIFLWNQANDRNLPESKTVSTLSYVSFSMYLFHRPVFSAMKWLYCPSEQALQWVYLLGIGLPAVVMVSWFVQRQYDAIVAPAISGKR